MKLIGKYLRSLFNSSGELEVTFKVDNHYYVRQAQTLNEDDMLKLDISVVKQKRSQEQNRLMWALLHQLEIVTEEDSWNWYCKALEETRAKFTYRFIPDTEDDRESIKTEWRASTLLGKRTLIKENGEEIELLMYRCYYGSSKHSVEEMTKLIDTISAWCYEHDIDIDILKYEEV